MQVLPIIQRDHSHSNEHLVSYLKGILGSHRSEIERMFKALKYGLRYVNQNLKSFVLEYYSDRNKIQGLRTQANLATMCQEETGITLEGGMQALNDDSTVKCILPWCSRTRYLNNALNPIALDFYLSELPAEERKETTQLSNELILIQLENYIQQQSPNQQENFDYQIVSLTEPDQVMSVTSQLMMAEEQADIWHAKYKEVREKYIIIKDQIDSSQLHNSQQEMMLQELRILHAMVDYLMPQGYKQSKKLGFTGWRNVNTQEGGLTVEEIRDYNRRYFMRSLLFLDQAMDFHPAMDSDSVYVSFLPRKQPNFWKTPIHKIF